MKPISIIALILSLMIVGCNDRYDEGYKNGYDKGLSKGIAEGQEDGYGRGLQEGYNKGYADGFEKNNKDVTIVDSKLRASIRTSLKIFTVIFYGINIISLLTILGYLVTQRHNNFVYIVAKSLFVLMSIAVSYLIISATNFGHIADPVLSDPQKWIIITLIFPITFAICFIVRKILIKYNVIYSDIMAIVLSTSVLVFFSFFLLDINVFVLTNEFISYCVISVSGGGLGFSGYTLIAEKMTDNPIG